MSNIIKVGSFDVTSIKIGSSDVDKVMVGTVKVYPQETPVTSYKWLATYATGTSSAECDATSAITRNEISGSSGTYSNQLISVIIGDCVTTIGEQAFRQYSSLSSVTIGSGVTSIGKNAFMGCNALTSITIPNSVTTIGESAFESCGRLTSVTIPDSVTTIERWAFHYCDSLQTVTIGSGITSIGEYAFQISSDKITAVTINATTPPTVGSVSFIGTYPIYVPCASVDVYKTTGNWTRYADRIRCNQTNMQITYLAASKVNVDLNGFTPAATAETFADGLGRIEFASDVTSVGTGFSGKTSVTSVFLPDTVTSIGNSAFTQCTNLSSCIIPSGVTSIGNGAFKTCSAMTNIDIPSSVTSIGENTFSGCRSLQTVTIGSGVTSIGEQAFQDCTALTGVTIPNSVTSIGDFAFEVCYSLELIIIPNSVTSIGRGAFIECSGLTEVTIGSGVTSIDQSAFQHCPSITAITVNATTPPTLASANVFDSTNNCPINVPCASVSAYKAATYWSTYRNRIGCEGPVDYKTKYFTVVLDQSGTITYSANSTANTVQYSTDDGSTWTSLQSRTSTPSIAGGKKVLFKATGLTVNNSNGIGKFSATTNFAVEGNPMSLVSGDSFANADTIPNNNQFRGLFNRVNLLTNAENLVLPATTLTNGCYYQMFGGCTKLITGPRKMEIPSTMPTSGCSNMFSGCSSMTECLMDVGSLSSSTLGNACYYYMFNNCKSLTALTSNSSQVMLPAAVTLPNQAYYGMFAGCSALTQSVYIAATDIPSSSSAMCQMFSGCSNISEIYCATTGLTGMCNGSYGPMYMWVSGTGSAVGAANCKFHKHINATWDTSCTQYYATIPQGWQVLSDITT